MEKQGFIESTVYINGLYDADGVIGHCLFQRNKVDVPIKGVLRVIFVKIGMSQIAMKL